MPGRGSPGPTPGKGPIRLRVAAPPRPRSLTAALPRPNFSKKLVESGVSQGDQKMKVEVFKSRENQRVRQIVAGDMEAFRALVQDYHPLAYDLAFKTLNDSQDAEEVVQDAFVKIHRALGGFRGEAALKTWILRIVLRLSLNRRRDRARSAWQRLGLHLGDDGETRDTATAPNPETLCISRETRQLLLSWIDELPDHLRQVLVLNSLEELSYEEIARILQIPLGTVSSRIYTARKKLLNQLEQHKLLSL